MACSGVGLPEAVVASFGAFGANTERGSPSFSAWDAVTVRSGGGDAMADGERLGGFRFDWAGSEVARRSASMHTRFQICIREATLSF